MHAGDIDAAIVLSGADRLAGRRRTSGCSCAACVGSARAEGSHPTRVREQRPPPSEFRRVEPAALSRPSVSWCEAALDGPTPQAAIRQALITLTRQAGVSILVPGALDAVASAMVGFCDTVLTRARGGDSQLLRDIAASDRRVDCLREVCAARYDALRDAGSMPADVESGRTICCDLDSAEAQRLGLREAIVEEPLDSDSSSSDHEPSDDDARQRRDDVPTSDDEASELAKIYDGLTSETVGDALAYLQVPVYGEHWDYPECMKDGVNYEECDFAGPAMGSDPEADTVPVDHSLNALSTRTVIFDSHCPDCGRLCSVTRCEFTLDNYSGQLERDVSAIYRPIASRLELERLPSFESIGLDDEVEAYRGGLQSPSGALEEHYAAHACKPFFGAAMREAGVRFVSREFDCLDLFEIWTKELMVLAQAARDGTEATSTDLRGRPMYESRKRPPVRYVHVLHAIIQILEKSSRRLHPVDLQTVDFDESALQRRTCDTCAKRLPLTAKALQVCARCGGRRYCSTACQREDWSNHRVRCVERPSAGPNMEPVRTAADREDDANVRANEANEDVVRRTLGVPLSAHEFLSPRDFNWERTSSTDGKMIQWFQGPRVGFEVCDDDANELISWWLSRRIVRILSTALRVPGNAPRIGSDIIIDSRMCQLARRLNYERC